MPVGGYVPVPSDPQFDDVNLLVNNEDSVQNADGPSATASKLSIEYYRTYFDVDTYQVVQRVLSGLIPFSKRFSLAASLKPAPDLYGPFWITVTIIFSVAFSGSVYEYILSNDASALSTFNFGRVTISSALLFLYWCLLPAILTSVIYLKRQKFVPDTEVVQDEPDLKFSSLFTELLAIYGYSMISFVPAAMLLCIPASFLQYALIGIACVISLIVLCTTTWSTFKQRRKKLAIGLLVLIIVAHLIMTISLSMAFDCGIGRYVLYSKQFRIVLWTYVPFQVLLVFIYAVFFHQPVHPTEPVKLPLEPAADAKSKSDPKEQAPKEEEVKPAQDGERNFDPGAAKPPGAAEAGEKSNAGGKKEPNVNPKHSAAKAV